MLQIISPRTHLVFTHPGDPHIKVSIEPLQNIRVVPDWVRQSETFTHALKAGLIIEVQSTAPVPAAAPARNADQQKPDGKTKPAGKGAN